MSSHEMRISAAGRPLSPGAVAVMLMLCLSWGFNQIAVKLALPDIPPMLQATIRSAGALLVLLLIARLRGVKIFKRDGTRGRVYLYRAVFRRVRLLFVSWRTAARLAMGRSCIVFHGCRAGDRRSPGRCRRKCAAGRPDDRRGRRVVGGDHADCQSHPAAHGSGGKGSGIPGS